VIRLRFSCGGIFNYHFVRHLLLSLSVKKFWKSVSICKVRGKSRVAPFFRTRCIYSLLNLYLLVLRTMAIVSFISFQISNKGPNGHWYAAKTHIEYNTIRKKYKDNKIILLLRIYQSWLHEVSTGPILGQRACSLFLDFLHYLEGNVYCTSEHQN